MLCYVPLRDHLDILLCLHEVWGERLSFHCIVVLLSIIGIYDSRAGASNCTCCARPVRRGRWEPAAFASPPEADPAAFREGGWGGELCNKLPTCWRKQRLLPILQAGHLRVGCYRTVSALSKARVGGGGTSCHRNSVPHTFSSFFSGWWCYCLGVEVMRVYEWASISFVFQVFMAFLSIA